LLAEVVGPAFHVADAQRTEERFEEGNVFEEKLFLKIFCAGRDDDALLMLAGAAQGRQKIGESFSGAGASFDDEMTSVGKALLYLACHGVLAGAMLKGERRLREDAAGMEELVERGQTLLGVDFGMGGGGHGLRR